MNMREIARVSGRRVWDSRGRPTVEVEVALRDGSAGRAIAPAGASCGSGEAIDLRDGGRSFGGLDVTRAVAAVGTDIEPALRGVDAADQALVDARIDAADGTGDFSVLGGNAAVAASLAVGHAAAAARKMPLWAHYADIFQTAPSIPLPEIQIFGGGAHAARRVDVQDFMVMVPGASSFDEALAVTAEIYRAAGEIMSERGQLQGVADEGGWWPVFESNEDALETLVAAIERAGEVPGERVVISLDIAATQLCVDGGYQLVLEESRLDETRFLDLLEEWRRRFPIAAIEDPVSEKSVAGMANFTRRNPDIQVIGDDFLVTDARRVESAIACGACNALLVKVNQAGTVSRAVAAHKAAAAAGWGTIVSARSGESEDVSIAHLSVGLGAGQLKVGSFARGERTAKWNEVLRIAEHFGDGVFAAGAPLASTWWGKRYGSGL
jgi:enolase